MTTIESRLERLDRSHRWYRTLSMVLAFVVICIVSFGQAPAIPKAIEAERIVFRDQAGNVRMELKLEPADKDKKSPISAGIWLYGDDGKERATIKLQGNRPSLAMDETAEDVRQDMDGGFPQNDVVLDKKLKELQVPAKGNKSTIRPSGLTFAAVPGEGSGYVWLTNNFLMLTRAPLLIGGERGNIFATGDGVTLDKANLFVKNAVVSISSGDLLVENPPNGTGVGVLGGNITVGNGNVAVGNGNVLIDGGFVEVTSAGGKSPSAVLGPTETKNVQTGAVTKTTAATITLYGADGKVLSQTP